ncbi:fibrinogen C domain-containing protein 1-B-like [Lingula anatina]|uniref:Fibrinogen C domain-containing protein 1-B-like n=1 Tax=Lingula anatina TaxID=7574 RepID=A0A1S3ISE9_LINAN|nr:fibrinogen C domain-containing protein 1-B-like [Lingula anatina]|eukprot:XP_013401135.1 fibrinogen C domain-containing protein 1-B-like [Lingula anatina]
MDIMNWAIFTQALLIILLTNGGTSQISSIVTNTRQILPSPTPLPSQCSLNDRLLDILQDTVKGLTSKVDTLQDTVHALQLEVATLKTDLAQVTATKQGVTGRDCVELNKNGAKLSGVYTIEPADDRGQFEVYCDMETDGGGWTVFQKRVDGSVDFYRGWQQYKLGFGNLNGEFWLGNDFINRLTSQERYELRVDLEDTSGIKKYALYDSFSITSERTGYQLSLGTYSGDAGDSLGVANYGSKGMKFSTKDMDNDVYSGNCATQFKGAWWYSNCHSANLNGLYHHGAHTTFADGINWKSFKGHHYSLKRTEMKIRPAGFKFRTASSSGSASVVVG